MNRVMDILGCKEYFDSMPMAFMVVKLFTDKNGKPEDFGFVYVNPSLASLGGVKPEFIINKRFYGDIFRSGDRKWLDVCYDSASCGKTSEWCEFIPEIHKYLKMTVYPWIWEGCCACIICDETDVIKAKSRLEYLAKYDANTDTYNKNAYMEFVATHEPRYPVGVMFVDINGLKACNDLYGHEAGDYLISLVADTIGSCIRKNADHVFRIGGDEFIVVLENCPENAFMGRVEALKKNLINDTAPKMPDILASVGYSWADKDKSIGFLAKAADKSMYRAKQEYYKNKQEKEGGTDLA